MHGVLGNSYTYIFACWLQVEDVSALIMYLCRPDWYMRGTRGTVKRLRWHDTNLLLVPWCLALHWTCLGPISLRPVLSGAAVWRASYCLRGRDRGGWKTQWWGKHTIRRHPQNSFGPSPLLWYVRSSLVAILSFPFEEKGTDQTNPTFWGL